jgi:uncharacterized phage protein (TIGR01671 family)
MEYRIWDTKNNKYFEPTYRAYDGKLEELLLSPSGALMMRTISGIAHESTFPDRFVSEFSSGKKDKNGRKIYSGDILKLNAMGENIGEVVFDSNNASFKLKRKREYYETECLLMPLSSTDEYNDGRVNFKIKITFEVIGNIHENPELLK